MAEAFSKFHWFLGWSTVNQKVKKRRGSFNKEALIVLTTTNVAKHTTIGGDLMHALGLEGYANRHYL